MSLFSSPKQEVVKEDPAVAAARQRQQTQADATLTMGIQDNLRTQMQARLQRFGLVPSAGGPSFAPSAVPAVGQTNFKAGF